MRSVSSSMQAKLDASVSTFCNCWRLSRKDGTVMGFTDHDRDLSFSAVTFRAASGLTATQVEASVGLGAGSGEILGALQSDGLVESDLANGLYDGASIEVWLVDWSDVEDRLLIDVATIGEVKRSEFAFAAELRSLAHLFDQQRGNSFQRSCSADLGDARCKFDLTAAGFHTTGVVVAQRGGGIIVDLVSIFDDDFFTGGRLSFTSGADAGARATIKSHRRAGAQARLTLWTEPSGAIAPGDGVEIVAGCDKTAASCERKFSNIVNFRGFPHMPGNDRVIAYPSSLAPTMDGGSFYR
ncbi:MAG: beta tubulin [Methylocystaceae bacterium]|nr:MAG: beta tubulin [Methylocystaceae bacterium]